MQSLFGLFGRSHQRTLHAWKHLPSILTAMLAARAFQDSWHVLACYLGRKCPSSLCVVTRRGYKVHLTGDQDDVVTLLVVIGRKDYGKIPVGGVVIDIGAHLGAFSLYAVSEGANKVYSFEPDPVLYTALRKNIAANTLGHQIVPCRAAVVGVPSERVTFYPEGNASGHIDPSPRDTGGISVDAVTLPLIIQTHQLNRVDLLKLDCEGSEYEILFNTPQEVWDCIERVRMEYHRGQTDKLKQRFQEMGYTLTKEHANTPQVGLLWFDRIR